MGAGTPAVGPVLAQRQAASRAGPRQRQAAVPSVLASGVLARGELSIFLHACRIDSWHAVQPACVVRHARQAPPGRAARQLRRPGALLVARGGGGAAQRLCLLCCHRRPCSAPSLQRLAPPGKLGEGMLHRSRLRFRQPGGTPAGCKAALEGYAGTHAVGAGTQRALKGPGRQVGSRPCRAQPPHPRR